MKITYLQKSDLACNHEFGKFLCNLENHLEVFIVFLYCASPIASLTNRCQDLDDTCKLIPKSKPTFQNFSIENFEFQIFCNVRPFRSLLEEKLQKRTLYAVPGPHHCKFCKYGSNEKLQSE